MVKEHLPENEKSIDDKDTRFLFEQYHVLANDRIHHNQLFWNVPGTFLTAQSFLLILALGGFTDSLLGHAIGGLIGLFLGLLSIQGFERNRFMEISDAELMLDIEKHFVKLGYRGLEVHQLPMRRKYLDGDYVNQRLCNNNKLTFFNRGIGYDLWKFIMWIITVTSGLLFLYNIFIFSFSNQDTPFLYWNSFQDFLDTFNKGAISTILIIAALNCVFCLIGLIQNQQPLNFPKKVLVNEETTPSEKKRPLRSRIFFIEATLISIAIIISILIRYTSFPDVKFLWGICFIICVCLIPFSKVTLKKISKYGKRHHN